LVQHADALQAVPMQAQPIGGSSRAASVLAGLRCLRAQGCAPDDWVLVHDAARCLVTPEQISSLMRTCWDDPVGGLLAVPLADTLKASQQGRATQTVARDDKWLAQTPQMFRLGALSDALQAIESAGFAGVTDEASAMERLGHAPRLVPADAHNFKVTYPHDFVLAQALLLLRQQGDAQT
jgi:2-C-methyl-D-erythritol 4-phosphate cytidylyltransferase